MKHDWQNVEDHHWACAVCGLHMRNHGSESDEQYLVGECRGPRQWTAVTLKDRRGPKAGHRQNGPPQPATPESIREQVLTSLAALADPPDPDLCRRRIEQCQTSCDQYLDHGACRRRGQGCTAWKRWREAIALGSCDRFAN
jgi:hypothetical protein